MSAVYENQNALKLGFICFQDIPQSKENSSSFVVLLLANNARLISLLKESLNFVYEFATGYYHPHTPNARHCEIREWITHGFSKSKSHKYKLKGFMVDCITARCAFHIQKYLTKLVSESMIITNTITNTINNTINENRTSTLLIILYNSSPSNNRISIRINS
eukprot:107695_1